MLIMKNLNLISVQSWTYLVCLNFTILMLLASSVHMLQQMIFLLFLKETSQCKMHKQNRLFLRIFTLTGSPFSEHRRKS